MTTGRASAGRAIVPREVGPGVHGAHGHEPGTAGARAVRRPRPRIRPEPADVRPVARVAVDVSLPHLDRLFDYQVPRPLDAEAVPGCRVRVRFAGRPVGGFVIERAERTDHGGGLAFLDRVVSPEPVLTPEIAGLARAVADRYGGTLADVLRLAVPPRHARTEAQAPEAEIPAVPVVASPPAPDGWDRYPAGQAFLTALAQGRSPRAVWSALPGVVPGGPSWPREIATACVAAAASGRGALVVVPDAADLRLTDAALAAVLPAGAYAVVSAQLGAAERYRRWLAVLRGQVRVVAGTRSAMFAPIADLGLVVLWDDGDDLHAEPRAPYPHARDVLALRAHRTKAAALFGGYAMTAEAAQLLAIGWARSLSADRAQIRRHAPLMLTAGQEAELARDEAARTARMPMAALRTARDALAVGPVLFQVPRRGYLAAVACRTCGARVRCATCSGPVALAGPDQPPGCGWCGTPAGSVCRQCGGTGLRALITGADRTAEELARIFPRVRVRVSIGTRVLASVPASPSVVIATPGAEPLAGDGYAAAILLDGWALLGRPSLRAAQEALRRWMNAAALVRSRSDGGKVVVLAEPGLSAVQALVRWDAAAHAERELAEREELRFPPAVRMAALSGAEHAVGEVLRSVRLPDGADVLGPVPAADDGGASSEPGVRYLVRVPSPVGTAMAAALRAGLAERSARKSQGTVRLQLDPAELI